MKSKFYLFLLSMMIACPFSGLYSQTPAEKVKKDRARNIVLPKDDAYHYIATQTFIEDEPDSDYLRARDIGNYGDYFTPENVVHNDESTNMPWMTIYQLGSIWSYDPDATGVFHPEAVKQLEETGKWLEVNGEGIYETRQREIWTANQMYFTRSKDYSRIYAFVENWQGKELVIPTITSKRGSKIFMLGYDTALQWTQTKDGIKVIVPDVLQASENRPCKYA